jgi:hypothetical protein
MLADVAEGKSVSYRSGFPFAELEADIVLLFAGINDICQLSPAIDVRTRSANFTAHPRIRQIVNGMR